jgi:hypothetical protein
LIYDLDEEVPPNVPDRLSKFGRTSRKEKSVVQTRSSSLKLKRPPQDSVARKPSSKDQILRKKQKTESTVSSSWKDKKPKSKKHKRKKHKSKKKERGKRKHKANSKRKRRRSKNTKQGQSVEGKSKDSSSRSKIIQEVEDLRSTEELRAIEVRTAVIGGTIGTDNVTSTQNFRTTWVNSTCCPVHICSSTTTT